MVMEQLQIRISKGLVDRMDSLVKEGIYSSRSDAMRDAVRRLVLDKELAALVGIAPNTGDSVKEVRELRKKLSKEDLDLKEINKL